MKICCKCKQQKPFSEFWKAKALKDGLKSDCKTCARSAHKKWVSTNRERVREYDRQFYAANPERKRVGVVRWRTENPIRARELKRIAEASRRARKRQAFVERIDPQVVYKMYGGRCGICDELINGEFHVDHIKPLARGGEHSYANTQPAHPPCNSKKWAHQ